MTVSKETIVDQAIAILNEKGIESLTMRELANRLQIKPASLYWHIKNKHELFELIAEHICKQIPLNVDSNNEREQIIQMMSAYRKNLLQIRDSVEIFNETPPSTPARINIILTILNKLENMGVKKENLIQTGHLLNNYVLAFVADEIRMQDVAKMGTESFFGYPYDFDFDQQFMYGLEVILNGIESMKDE
ncbi:AcrR family transcriptional regulator [Caldalkalibacillus uzonensis]|uniref:AcrR family transcriptional regulator n=1 Tax=Caldalkalibacillus uzonensis TaxID=353224 RepID=A0ABU0CXA7_9BACI|nr:TetR family transcriptional regulator [Caldalkalibacillus uzonensis]MDQ0340681.1 AcrR family transcriptional regulator [Caldalkalibacillus uzonensis]